MTTSRQLNIRLTPHDRDLLDALAFIRRVHASTLARDIVLDYLDRSSGEPGLTEARAALARHDAAIRPIDNVHPIETIRMIERD